MLFICGWLTLVTGRIFSWIMPARLWAGSNHPDALAEARLCIHDKSLVDWMVSCQKHKTRNAMVDKQLWSLGAKNRFKLIRVCIQYWLAEPNERGFSGSTPHFYSLLTFHKSWRSLGMLWYEKLRNCLYVWVWLQKWCKTKSCTIPSAMRILRMLENVPHTERISLPCGLVRL